MTTATWRPAKPDETPGQMVPELDHDCAGATCVDESHLPDRDDADTTWGMADDASWLWDDDRARRRADV